MSILKDISKTLGFSFIASLINLGFTPVIVRFVDPGGFYIFSTSLGISSVLVIFSTLKVDQIFQLKVNYNNVKILFYVFLIFSFLLSIAFCLSGYLLLSFNLIPYKYNFINLEFFKYTGLLIFCISLYNLLTGICFRKKALLLFGFSQILIQLFFNLILFIVKVNDNYNYLILIQAFVYFVGSVLLYFVDLRLFTLPKFRNIRQLFHDHKKYMIFPSLESLINTVGLYLPIILFGYYYGPVSAGLFAFVVRILNLPISFIASNIGRPLLNYYKNDLNFSEQNLFERKSKFYLRLVSLFFFPLFVVVYFTFDIFFQYEWDSSKWVAMTLVPWIFSLALSTPFSPIMYAKGKVAYSFNYQIMLFVIRFCVLIISGLLFNFYTALILFSLISSIMWIIFLNKSLNLVFTTKDYLKKSVIAHIFLVYQLPVLLLRFFLNRKEVN